MSLFVAEATSEALLKKIATDQYFFRMYSSGEDRGGALKSPDITNRENETRHSLSSAPIPYSYLTNLWALYLLQMGP